ncbi:MAG: hypothetical protein K6253_00625 [Candidatus Liberibacter asiaticus]|nr:hypothetical protein [Candidatus Liberibacter asiaticus]
MPYDAITLMEDGSTYVYIIGDSALDLKFLSITNRENNYIYFIIIIIIIIIYIY